MLRGEQDHHDVGKAGNGQRDEGRVDDGNKEDADEAEVEDPLLEVIAEGGVEDQGQRVHVC